MMKFQRIFTANLSNPYEGLEFETRTSVLRNMDGTQGSSAITICVPAFWSQVASDILAQKYVRKADVPAVTKPIPEEGIQPWLWRSEPDEDMLATMDKQSRYGFETDARQIFHRIAGCWAYWGVKTGTMDDAQAHIFYDEVVYLLAHQMAAPNSPQWFNTGLNWAYGISRPQRGHFRVDPQTRVCEEVRDPYVYPQAHACFIQSVDDDLCGENGIMDLWQKEARLFKFGSGTGSNFSNIRGLNEPLSCGGRSSGLLSFLHIGDAAAGAIKSGGTTRRAAKMVCLDADHPDIESFVSWKRTEEEKVAALVAGSRTTRHYVSEIQQNILDARPQLGEHATDFEHNTALRHTLRDALSAGIPESLLCRTLLAIKHGTPQPELEAFTATFDSHAYQSVSGQNANNSVRLSASFMDALEHDGVWELRRRTDGQVAKTIRAAALWHEIAYNAWACADPGLQFDTTINDWHTCPQSGPIRASNPCSEFMFLDDSACNLASINLVRFQKDDASFDIDAFEAAVRLFTVALDITVTMAQYPSRKIAQQSFDFRPLGLGFANLGSLFMRSGLPYDSPQARALASAIASITTAVAYRTSAELAKDLGVFEKYRLNASDMLRVIRNHRHAAYLAPTTHYAQLSVAPHLPSEDDFVPALLQRSRQRWDEVLEYGQKHGFRNAQVTCVAPTGTIGLLMDCDTTGVEPDFALVKFKKLVGGGYFRMINTAIPKALQLKGYSDSEIDDICHYILGHATIKGAPGINPESLRMFGFDAATIEAIDKAMPSAFDIRCAFAPAIVGTEFCRTRLKVPEPFLNDPTFDLLSFLGFTTKQIAQANLYAFGTMTIEGAPHLMPDDLPVFDCANRCGEVGTRFIPAMAHVTMMAAIQPFISGAISKTINFPADATIWDIEHVHRQSYKLGLKAIAIYRDGSKFSQPLSSTTLFDFSKLDKEDTASMPTADTPNCAPHANRRKLPSRRSGYTQKASINQNNIYLRTGEYADGSLGEIFIDMHKEGAAFRSLMNCFAIAVSLGLQHGVPLEEYVDAFVFTRFEPSGPVSDHGTIKFATSIIDYIFRELGITYLGKTDLVHVNPEDLPQDQHLDNEFSVPYLPGYEGRRMSHLHSSQTPASPLSGEHAAIASAHPSTSRAQARHDCRIARLKGYEGDPCPECGNFTMLRNGTCLKCDSCGATSGCS